MSAAAQGARWRFWKRFWKRSKPLDWSRRSRRGVFHRDAPEAQPPGDAGFAV
jgi:hypothetical protein